MAEQPVSISAISSSLQPISADRKFLLGLKKKKQHKIEPKNIHPRTQQDYKLKTGAGTRAKLEDFLQNVDFNESLSH